MKTKTREFEEIKQSEKTEAIAIPKSILDEVWEKWFYEDDANILTNLNNLSFSFICNLKYLLSYIVYRIYFDFDGNLCNNFVNL